MDGMLGVMKLKTVLILPTMNKRAVAFFFLFFLHGFSIGNGQQGISYNVMRLCDVAEKTHTNF
jgi:hypothetical protein